MKAALLQLFVLMCTSWLLECPAKSATTGKSPSVIVQPCRSKAIRVLPITSECTAAAIAENAFLRETRHQISQYVIVSMRHTDTQWKFVIERGDGTHPPDGDQWMVFVDRSTGKVELIAGR